MSDVNANVNINIDSSAALVNLRRLEAEINQFQKGLQTSNMAWNKSLVDGISSLKAFDTKVVSAHDSVSRFNDQLDRGKLSLGQYTRFAASQMPGMSRVFKKEFDTIQQVAESRVKKINTQYLALGKTVDGITKAIAATPTGLAKGYATDLAMATQRQQLFNKMIDDGSTKLLNWGKNTQWAGRQLMVGFSIPLAALGTVAAKTFMEIDKATVALRRVYGDLDTTTKEVDNNIDAIKKLGAEYTKYGVSLQETINIGAKAAATGATNEKLAAATEQTLRLATLGQIDYNQALDATISLQSAFAISNKELGETIDFLNAVENQTVLSLDDMTLAVPRVATVIKGLGGDVKDLAVFMTAMREGGVSAENAANALKSGLASLINPTNAAKEALGKLGINIDAIVQTNRGDLMGTIQAFGQELNGLDKFSRQQALEKVFGKYQYARMGALFENITKSTSQAARAMDVAKMSAEDLAKVANKELTTLSESTSVKFQAAMEQLKIAIAPLGEAFLKGITPIVNMVTKVADAFNNLPDAVKNSVVVITAVVAGLGPVLLMTIGLLGNGFANIIKTVQFFRKSIARIKGDASAFTYMSTAELEAEAATNSLNSAANGLTGTLGLQKSAVAALTAEYERFIAVAGIASGEMRGMGGGPSRGQRRPPIRRATGGTIPGSGNTDTVPAMLTPGEFVVNKQSTAQNLPLLHAINDGSVSKFAGGGRVGMAQALGRFLGRRTQFAHATESRLVATKEAKGMLRPAELAFVSAPGKGRPVPQTHALSRLTLGVSDLENQALRMGVGNGLDPKIFAERIKNQKQTPRLFERLGLPKGTSQTFRQILSEEVGKITKNPMFDDDLAKAFNRAEKRMKGQLKEDAKLQEKFVQAISAAREESFTRIKFSLPPGSPSAANVEAAKRLASKSKPKLPNYDTPFYYYHAGSRKASALVKVPPDGRIVGVQTDATRKIVAMANGGSIVPGSGNSDTVPAMLTPGEFVINKQSTKENLPLLHAINDGNISQSQLGFNKGGQIPGVQYFAFGARVLPQSIRTRLGSELSGRSIGRYMKDAYTTRKIEKYAVHGGSRDMVGSTPLLQDLSGWNPSGFFMTGAGGRKTALGNEATAINYALRATADTSKIIGDPTLKSGSLFGIKSKKRSAKIIYGTDKPTKEFRDQTLKLLEAHGIDQQQIRHIKGAKNVDELVNFSRQVVNENNLMHTDPLIQQKMNEIFKTTMQLDKYDAYYGLSLNKTTSKAEKYAINRSEGSLEKYKESNARTFSDTFEDANQIIINPGRLGEIDSNVWAVNQKSLSRFGQDYATQSRGLEQNQRFGVLDKKRIDYLNRYIQRLSSDPKVNKESFSHVESAVQSLKNFYKQSKETVPVSHLKAIEKIEGKLKKAIDSAPEAFVEMRSSLNSGGMIFASNGVTVPGTGNTDTVPAMLTPGEFVVNKDATRKNLPLLRAINGGQVKGYAEGDVVASQTTGYKAPPQIASQTKQMQWSTRAAENAALTKVAERWGVVGTKLTNALNTVAAHIVPSTGGKQKTWNPKNLVADTHAINEYMNRTTKVAKSMSTNTEVLNKISKATGVSLGRVRRELENFARGQHPITETSARVLRKVASMDEAASRMAQRSGQVRNIYGAKAETGYFAGMTKAVLSERLKGDFYRSRTRQRAYTGETYVTQTGRRSGGRSPIASMTEPVPHAGMLPIMMGSAGPIEQTGIKGRGSQSSSRYSSTALRARQLMKEGGLDRNSALTAARAEEAAAMQRREIAASRGAKIGGAFSKFGGTMGMASMIPFMAQDEQGKFMGMNANMLGMGMMGGQMAMPMIGKGVGSLVGRIGASAALAGAGAAGAGAAGGGGAAGGAGILATVGALASNPVGWGVAAVAAAAAIVGAGLILWRKNIDDNARETAKLTSNLGVTANSVSEMGKILGKSTPQQRQAMQQLGLTKEQQQVAQESVIPQLQSEGGKKLLQELKAMNPQQQQKRLEDYTKSAVATRMMSKDEAVVFAKALGSELGNINLGANVSRSITGQKEGAAGMLELTKQRMRAVEADPLVKQAMAASGAVDSVTSAAAAAAVGGSMQVFSDLADTVALANEDYKNGIITFKEYNDIINQSKIAQEKYMSLYTRANTGSMEQGGTRQAVADQLIASGKMTQEQYDVYAHGLDIGTGQFLGADSAFITESIAAQAAQDPKLAAAMKGTGKRAVAGGAGGYTQSFQTEQDLALVEKARAEAEKGQADYQAAMENGMQAQFDAAIFSNELTVEQAVAFQTYLKSGTKNAMDAVKTIKETGDVALANFQASAKEQGMSQDYISAVSSYRKNGGNIGDAQTFMASFSDAIQPMMSKLFKQLNFQQQSVMIKDQQNLSARIGAENTSRVQSSASYRRMVREGKSTDIFTSEAEKANQAGIGTAYGNVIATMTTHDNGKPISSNEFADRSKKVRKALTDFQKGDSVVKKRSIISLLTQMEDSKGNPLTGQQATDMYDELIRTYGKQRIENLPPDIISKVIQFRAIISDIDLKIMEQTRILNDPNSTDAQREAAGYAIYSLQGTRGRVEGQEAGVISEQPKPTTTKPPPTGGAGGGTDALAEMKKGLLRQIQQYEDLNATMKQLDAGKFAFIKNILKSKGLTDKLLAIKGLGGIGLDPGMMDAISQMDPKDQKRWLKENTNKKGQLNKRGRMYERTQVLANIESYKDENAKQLQYGRNQLSAATQIGARTRDAEVIQSIAGDAQKASDFLKANEKQKRRMIEDEKKLIALAKERARAEDPIQAAIDDENIAYDRQVKVVENLKQPLQDQIDLYNKQIDQLQRLNDSDQHRIDGLERQKEMIQRQIDGLQRQNDMDQRRADALRREDEIRNRVADAHAHDLEILSKQEESIKTGYQKRIDALNKISEINQHQIDQQRQQLNLSQALSQGDIYAAANASMDARQSNAEFAAQQQQNALQQGQENAVAGLRTASGLTREQAEQQIADIKEQSYQTNLKIRDIEDVIYQRNLEMTALKDQQYNIDQQELPIKDAIYARDQQIYQIQKDKIQPLQDQIDKYDDQLKAMERIHKSKIDQLEEEKLNNEMLDSQRKTVNALAQQYKGVADQVRQINEMLDKKTYPAGIKIPEIKPGESWDAYAARINAFRESVAANMQGANNAGTGTAAVTTPMFTGGMIRAATGMMVPGSGGMDSVPILAAPGEFVMRKAAVNKYGPAMMQAMNMGAYQMPQSDMMQKMSMGTYQMPKYNIGGPVTPTISSGVGVGGGGSSIVSAPVYNSYSVNVNVAGTNASADEIANRTIMKIKDMKNVNIRSARG